LNQNKTLDVRLTSRKPTTVGVLGRSCFLRKVLHCSVNS
jgi:hypothetical protein